MRRVLRAAVLAPALVAAVIGAAHAAVGTIPDSANERLRAAIVATDCTQADCAPGLRVVRPVAWTSVSLASTNAQATTTRAAGGTNVRHVADCITATIVATSTTPAAITPSVSLIDGASGGGTYLWRSYLALPAVASETRTINLCGLALIGTANTAMTLEFNSAGGANTAESVTLTGYDLGQT